MRKLLIYTLLFFTLLLFITVVTYLYIFPVNFENKDVHNWVFTDSAQANIVSFPLPPNRESEKYAVSDYIFSNGYLATICELKDLRGCNLNDLNFNFKSYISFPQYWPGVILSSGTYEEKYVKYFNNINFEEMEIKVSGKSSSIKKLNHEKFVGFTGQVNSIGLYSDDSPQIILNYNPKRDVMFLFFQKGQKTFFITLTDKKDEIHQEMILILNHELWDSLSLYYPSANSTSDFHREPEKTLH